MLSEVSSVTGSGRCFLSCQGGGFELWTLAWLTYYSQVLPCRRSVENRTSHQLSSTDSCFQEPRVSVSPHTHTHTHTNPFTLNILIRLKIHNCYFSLNVHRAKRLMKHPFIFNLLQKSLFVFGVEVIYNISKSGRECLQDLDVVQAFLWLSTIYHQ